MSKQPDTSSLRVLSVQILSLALIFGVQNIGCLAERALLSADATAIATLGVSWIAFCLLQAFTVNMVNVCPLVVGRCTGDRDNDGARAAAGQALLLATGWGAVGIVVAVAAGIGAAFVVGPGRAGALFFATQALALGPLLATKAITGYFTGTMRVGPRLLAAVFATPIAVHLALAWLLTCPLSCSVVGAGLARLGAALAATAATLAVARAEFGGLMACVRRPDPALLRAMLAEGSVLGLQQVVAGFIVLLLYLTAIRAGDIPSAALTLTHSCVYPLLFSFAWGSSQAVGAAAAQAIGRGDKRELARVTRRCLALSAVLAFVLPWGAFALCGRSALAWLIGGCPSGGAILTASVRLMGLLAVFFVFDFAINFLSALLRAAREQVYLLKATVIVACVFGGLLVLLPARGDGTCQIGAFIAVQAVWAVLLLLRVARRWPATASRETESISRAPQDNGEDRDRLTRRRISRSPWTAVGGSQQWAQARTKTRLPSASRRRRCTGKVGSQLPRRPAKPLGPLPPV
jgi:Na+-driven multidrug efflux pump